MPVGRTLSTPQRRPYPDPCPVQNPSLAVAGAVATEMTLPFVPKLTKGMAPEKVAAMIESIYVRCPDLFGLSQHPTSIECPRL